MVLVSAPAWDCSIKSLSGFGSSTSETQKKQRLADLQDVVFISYDQHTANRG